MQPLQQLQAPNTTLPYACVDSNAQGLGFGFGHVELLCGVLLIYQICSWKLHAKRRNLQSMQFVRDACNLASYACAHWSKVRGIADRVPATEEHPQRELVDRARKLTFTPDRQEGSARWSIASWSCNHVIPVDSEFQSPHVTLSLDRR
jgi:hypothetical protein